MYNVCNKRRALLLIEDKNNLNTLIFKKRTNYELAALFFNFISFDFRNKRSITYNEFSNDPHRQLYSFILYQDPLLIDCYSLLLS